MEGKRGREAGGGPKIVGEMGVHRSWGSGEIGILIVNLKSFDKALWRKQ